MSNRYWVTIETRDFDDIPCSPTWLIETLDNDTGVELVAEFFGEREAYIAVEALNKSEDI